MLKCMRRILQMRGSAGLYVTTLKTVSLLLKTVLESGKLLLF